MTYVYYLWGGLESTFQVTPVYLMESFAWSL